MNVLVTGGAGYIGTTLVEKLNQQEDIETIFVYDNLSQPSTGFFLGQTSFKKVKFVEGDILDTYSLEKVLSKVDLVYHLAAFVSFPYNHQQAMQYDQINKWGTLNLVRSIKEKTNNIKKIIYLSSTSIYGLKDNIELNQAAAPSNAYGKSKYAGEKYVNLLENQVQVEVVRSANVFGFNNNLRMDSVVNNFIFKALTQGKILIYGNGNQFRPYASLDNLTTFLCQRKQLKNQISVSNFAEFNADLNELKDWLIEKIPDLEYTYINQNSEYEGQFINGLGTLKEHIKSIDSSFQLFRENIRINT